MEVSLAERVQEVKDIIYKIVRIPDEAYVNYMEKIEQGKYEEALDALNVLTFRHRENRIYAHNRALLCARLEKYYQAKEEIERAITIIERAGSIPAKFSESYYFAAVLQARYYQIYDAAINIIKARYLNDDRDFVKKCDTFLEGFGIDEAIISEYTYRSVINIFRKKIRGIY